MVKDLLWRQTQKAMYDKQSTTELTTKEVCDTYDQLDRFMRERFHVNVDWPSHEQDMLKSLALYVENNESRR